MAETPQSLAASSPGKVRVSALAVAIGALSVLLVAVMLTPDPRGFGTHQQLGLPPCLSEHYLGIPCPLCGMTTAFTLMADARPRDAVTTQPAGAFFFLMTTLVAAGAIASAITGYLPGFARRALASKPVVSITIAVMLGAWVYKLLRG